MILGFRGGSNPIPCSECEGYMVFKDGNLNEMKCNLCGVLFGTVRVGGRLL